MVHRDPETGQFTGGDHDYDDIEVASFAATLGVEAANLNGNTQFGGQGEEFEAMELIDYDEIVDRNEELHLLSAQHRMAVYANSTETADGTVAAGVEISADPAFTDFTKRIIGVTTTSVAGNGNVVGESETEDTIDLVGRPLVAMGGAPFSDSATGVGGAGSAGEDQYEATVFPAEMGRFHPRDELFLNGRITTWNIDDSGVHVNVTGQHIYGVVEG